MKVFLLKDVVNVGMAGEIVKVADGFALNFLVPRKLAQQVTPENEHLFTRKIKHYEQREQVVASKTSILAERIKNTEVVLRRKMHDGDKLYGSINEQEIVDALKDTVSIRKNQVEFDKSIKSKGTYTVTIKLSSQLKPKVTVKVVAEH